jgi:hypothetical protein
MVDDEVSLPGTPPDRSALEKRLRDINEELRLRAATGLTTQSYVAEALNSISTRDLEEEAENIRAKLRGDETPPQPRRPTGSERPLTALRALRWIGLGLVALGVAFGIYALATQTSLWGALGSTVSGAIIAFAASDVLRRNDNKR